MNSSGRLAPRGRGVALKTMSEEQVCICGRPRSNIHCNVCGFTMVGRLRRPCAVHPNTLFLMDIGQCPKCRSQAFMMEEH